MLVLVRVKRKILVFNLSSYHPFNIRINLSKKLTPNFQTNSPAVNIRTVSKALDLEAE